MENQAGDVAELGIYGAAGLIATITIPLQRALDLKSRWINKKLSEFQTVPISQQNEATIRTESIVLMSIFNTSEHKRKAPKPTATGLTQKTEVGRTA